jgi:hypothetical protein
VDIVMLRRKELYYMATDENGSNELIALVM